MQRFSFGCNGSVSYSFVQSLLVLRPPPPLFMRVFTTYSASNLQPKQPSGMPLTYPNTLYSTYGYTLLRQLPLCLCCAVWSAATMSIEL